MAKFRSHSEIRADQMMKRSQPLLIRSISKINFKSKYLSDKFDDVPSLPEVEVNFRFKDISDDKKSN